MKTTFALLVLCTIFASINCLPAAEETEQPSAPMNLPWYNSISYEYMMCRMSCKQSCMEQGYWRGVCKQGECFCYGFLGNSFPKMKEPMMPMF